MEKKFFRRHSLNNVHRFIIVSALLFVMLFHAKSEAATRLYIRKGGTGYLSFTSLTIPNAKWEVTAGKSCLKLKSSAARKPVYYGKKVGQATLTVYNKYNPSQRYDFYVYVMPSGKLNKMDFELYGTVVENNGYPSGTNFLNTNQNYKKRRSWLFFIFGEPVNKNNSGTYFQTTRTAKLFDSYKRITMLYGKASLKKWNASKDNLFQKKVKSRNYGPPFKSTVKYYAQYKYGKTYGIRFYFNRKKEVVALFYLKNWI